MRASCVICAEIFEFNSPNSDVAALGCGHTFHFACISQWIETNGPTKSTCPSCRALVDCRKTVSRLYFNENGDGEEEGDYGRVKNELDNVRLALKQKDKDISREKSNISQLQEKITALEESKEGIRHALREEQGTCKTLRGQVKLLESQQNEAKQCIKETRQLRAHLRELENVQKVITDSECDIQQVLSTQGTSEGAAKQMATYIVVLKRELDKVKEDRRSLRNENPKLKNSLQALRREVQQKDIEISSLQDRLNKTEAELQNKSLKLSKLEKALGSPSDSAVSLAKRFLHESPAPCSFTPTLSTPGNQNKVIDLDASFVPDTPEILMPSPNTQMKRECDDNDIQYIKFSKAGFSGAKRVKKDTDLPPPMLNFNILKKKETTSSIIRTGYNGLGGHKNHVNLSQKSMFKAPIAKPKKSTALRPLNVGKGREPALPSLKGFLS